MLRITFLLFAAVDVVVIVVVVVVVVVLVAAADVAARSRNSPAGFAADAADRCC